MPKDHGIGASVKRREDVRFLTGKGRYTDDINRPGQTYVALPALGRGARADHPARHHRGRGDARACSRSSPATDFAAVGGMPCGWQVTDRFGQPMQEPKHPVLAEGKVRHVGDPIAAVVAETLAQARDAAEAIELDIEELPAVVDMRAALGRGRAEGARRADARTSASTGASSRTTRDAVDAAIKTAHARHHARAGQQPAGAERRWSRARDRRVRRRRRPAHALHHQPEPARDPAADGRLRARHPRAQAAGGGAGRRRRLRLEDLPLRRGGLRHLRGQGGRAAGEVDLDPVGGLHLRRARARPCDQDRAGRSTRTASSWRSAPTTLANMGAYLSTFAPCIPTYLHGTLMAGNYATPLIYVNVQGGLHQHRAGRRLSRRRAAGGDLPDRAASSTRRRASSGSTRWRSGGSNFVKPDQFPYQTPVAVLYDTGNYHATMDKLRGDLRPRRLRRRGGRGERGAGQAARLRRRRPTSRPAASRRRASSARSAPAPGSTRARRSG